jgi:hypothetical protein
MDITLQCITKFKNKTVVRIYSDEEDSRITSLISISALPFEYFVSTTYNFFIHRWPTNEEINESIFQHKTRKVKIMYITLLILVPENIKLALEYSPYKDISLQKNLNITTITYKINL